jgi:hypothetical protein
LLKFASRRRAWSSYIAVVRMTMAGRGVFP